MSRLSNGTRCWDGLNFSLDSLLLRCCRVFAALGPQPDMRSDASFRDDLINRVIRYPSAIAIRVRVARLSLLGMKIGRKCWIRRIRVPRNPWDVQIDDMVALDDDVVLLTTGA